jgi:signal transduction histidine kinase/CheY-like chemotaxis protein
MRTEELLKQSQSLAQELQSQQEELRQTNEELEDKARLLEEQKVEVERKNKEVESAKLALEDKAEQLSLTSKYKSEFLSNMSHELRTPLNSLLILAQQLAENPTGNLTEKQMEFARTIQGSGRDLLGLINEILDLSKIESGTVTLELETVTFADLREQIDRTFRHVAENRGLSFDLFFSPRLPPAIHTDEKRLMQVIKNLLSNALKFTDKGGVGLRAEPAVSGWSVDHAVLNQAAMVIGFYVTDTGIGVPADKQKIIFEAFQQADAGTSRKYGGTGLGLSISREIARLLGGELRLLSSEAGRGSTFVFFVPVRNLAPGGRQSWGGGSPSGHDGGYDGEQRRAARNVEPSPRETPVAADKRGAPEFAAAAGLPNDDRAGIRPGDRTLLIVEDDPKFAAILLQAGREKGFKGIVSGSGNEALQLAESLTPTAITLDLHLPDLDGWVVLERLKNNPAVRHIPVEIISIEDNRPRALRFGAYEYLVKPVTAEALQKALAGIRRFAEQGIRDLLLADADADAAQRKAIAALIGNGDVRIKTVTTAAEALAALRRKRYDCLVVDNKLQDMGTADLLESLQGNEATREMPVILYGVEQLSQSEQDRLKTLAGKGIVKDAATPERLLDETALFLHRVVSKLPEDRRLMLEKLHAGDDALAGKKVLVVDDDIRNIFALTAALERQKMQVISAENGNSAIELLMQNPDTDAVLMDIMMPDLDGYETMRKIRAVKKFEALPMIALTAKAMKGDREKCIEAGASDYVSKPVDIAQLLSLLRVWLYK